MDRETPVEHAGTESLQPSAASRRAPTLATQLMLAFTAIVLLTALAAWIPESWLIHEQFEQMTWAQVAQGYRGSQALYSSWESEVENAALLASQLPALQTLLAEGETGSLSGYLETLDIGVDLDLLAVCSQENVMLAQIGAGTEDSAVCIGPGRTRFLSHTGSAGSQVWLLAARSIGQDTGSLGSTVAGVQLNNAFAREMLVETGMQHTILLNGDPIATSFAGGLAHREGLVNLEASPPDVNEQQRSTFTWQGQPYYAIRYALAPPSLQVELALEASEIVALRHRLLRTVTVSILLTVLIGSVVGIIGARRLSRPLMKMRAAASRFSRGDLTSPVEVSGGVREVALVSETLERARIDLQESLTALQQEKAWVEHLLEAIVEGIVTLDDNNLVTFFSLGAQQITGWRQEDVVGLHADDLFQLVDSEQPFTAVIPGPGQRRKAWVRLPERDAVLSFTRADLIPPEAGAARAALVFRDVSEEEAVQQLLRHFLANVTHEFRTPLTALGASVELLLDQSPDLTQQELEQMLSWLHVGILSLQTLVDNLLESTSLESGHFRIVPHAADIEEIVSEAVHLMQPLLEKYRQELVVEIQAALPAVRADSRRIVQVLVNMLSNANKYAPEKSTIELRAQLHDDPAKVVVSVSDRGPGITDDARTILFEPFSRFISKEATKPGKYGIGLGLSVVKAIVEAHRGDVGVEDRPSGGATFWFTLPLERAV